MANIEAGEKKIVKQDTKDVIQNSDPKEQMALLIERIKADGLFQQGEMQLSKNKIKDAIETFNKLISDFQFSDKVPKSQLRLGELYIKTEDYTKAELVLRDFIKNNGNSPDYIRTMFILAEALYSQYKYDIGSTRSKMLEAKRLYSALGDIDDPKDKEIKDKSNKKLNECEIQLAENDFLAVHVYERIERYRSALTRLRLMRKDFETNKTIIKRIDEMYPRIEELYKKQNEKNTIKQLSQLYRILNKLNKSIAVAENSIKEFEAKGPGKEKNAQKNFDKQLSILKQEAVNIGREIVWTEERIDEVKKHGYNPDLEPGMPDPNVVSVIIPGIDYEIIF